MKKATRNGCFLHFNISRYYLANTRIHSIVNPFAIHLSIPQSNHSNNSLRMIPSYAPQQFHR